MLGFWATDKDESLVTLQRRLKGNVDTGRRKTRIIRTMIPKGRQCFKKKGGAYVSGTARNYVRKKLINTIWIKQQSCSDGWELGWNELGKR